jgi:hypothetical protein
MMNEAKQKTNKKTIFIGGAALLLIAAIVLIIVFTRAKPAVFEVSDLLIAPAQAQPGQTVECAVMVTNTGGSEGSYTAEFKINGNLGDSSSFSLVAKKNHRVSFLVEETTPGTYNVDIGGLKGQFTILEPVNKPIVVPVIEPAVFQLTNLTVEPATVRKGQSVSITATITNAGGSTGNYNAELKINGTAVDTQSVSLAADAKQQIVFTSSGDMPGTYSVEIGGLTGEFTVRPVELRTWVIIDDDIPRLFAMISKVSLTSHFIPGNQAEFVMAGFPGVVDIGIVNGKLCEYPVSPEIYMMLPEIHDYIFFDNGVEYLSYTWFDPAVEIAPDVTTMPVMVSVNTEDGKAIVIYEW